VPEGVAKNMHNQFVQHFVSGVVHMHTVILWTEHSVRVGKPWRRVVFELTDQPVQVTLLVVE
jgi:hypothetical protein